MEKIYLAFGINTDIKLVVALTAHRDKNICEKYAKNRLSEAKCKKYGIFDFYDNFGENFIQWLSEEGFTKLEAEDSLELFKATIRKKLSHLWNK
jgi:hypothetical protein